MVNLERCALCKAINFEDIAAKGVTLPLDLYVLAWQKGSDSHPHCGLCALMQSSLHHHRTKMGSRSTILRLTYNGRDEEIVVSKTTTEAVEKGHNSHVLNGFKGWMPYNEEFNCGFLHINRGIGESKSHITSRRLLSPNPGSNVCLDLAKRWLTECSKHVGATTTFVPSRLIDVRPSSEDEDVVLVSLRQQDGGNHSDPIKYVALSYCWGTDRFLTTTSSNIDAMSLSISTHQLPQTIRDAIKITRHLGVRYLWVDSLCIIQGTDAAARQDWLTESPMMGRVYQSAHCTISAESASTAVAGILCDRPKPSVDICAIPVSAGSSDVMYLTDHPLHEPEITEPLHLRCWTLQESIMSRRLLRFGTKEMSWRCPHGTEREGRVETLPCNKSDNTVTMEKFNEQTRSIYTGWRATVEDYSKRAVTVESDKLPAIEGLARVAQGVTDDIYVAGIWARGTPLNLLWKQQPHKPVYARKEQFEAPSWSWASVEGPILFVKKPDRMDDLDVEWKPCNDYTAVDHHKRHGLLITGHMVQVPSIRFELFGDYNVEAPWEGFAHFLLTYLDDLNDIPHDNKKSEEGNSAALTASWFLLLAKEKKGSGPMEFGAGLILLPVESEHNSFRRIGMFEGFPLDDSDGLVRKRYIHWHPNLSHIFHWGLKSPTRTIRLV